MQNETQIERGIFLKEATNSETFPENRGQEAHLPLQGSLSLSENDIRNILCILQIPSIEQIGPDLKGTLGIIFANILTMGAHSGIYYFRDRSRYVRPRRYSQKNFTYKKVLAAIDFLDSSGLIVHVKMQPSSHNTQSSYFHPTQTLREAIRSLPIIRIDQNWPEVIVLKNADGKEIDYKETNATRAIRKQVLQINDQLSQCEIRVSTATAKTDKYGMLQIGNQFYNPAKKRYRRLFKESLNLHGRLYGPFWQTLPAAIRKTSLILNDQLAIEEDFKACHFRILCAVAKWSLPFNDPKFDPFDIQDCDRKLVKRAFVLLINSGSEYSAQRALQEFVSENYQQLSDKEALGLPKKVIALAKSIFSRLHNFWHKSLALKLMKIDSEICLKVHEMMLERDVPCLSIHDSFMVPHQYRQFLRRSMEIAFHECTSNLQVSDFV